VGSLSFAGNSLESVVIHRSDGLESLKIWAPNLQNLVLQACYALTVLDFLVSHPMESLLPSNHVTPPLVGVGFRV
jgi:hypothetical protein